MDSILKQYTSEQVELAKKIELIICDVDGVLTAGGIIYDNQGNEFKIFNVKDGQIVKMLKFAGIKLGAITGRSSDVVRSRMKEMQMDFHYHGIKDKLQQYEVIKKDLGIEDSQIAFLGDDIIDIPVLERCGFPICPNDAKPYVQKHAKLVTNTKGGDGVFREVADLILASKGVFEEMMNKYLNKYQN